MKHFYTKKLLLTLTMAVFGISLVKAQVPPEQEVIEIEGGIENIGLLETTINSDTIAGGNRANPTRIYRLKKDQIYYMESRIQFGGDDVTDTTSTLIIEGETGGKKPIILMIPKDGGDAFTNLVHGSLTLRNLYWPVKTVTGKGRALFQLFRSNQTLRVEDCVTEYAEGGDLFVMSSVEGAASFFLINSYFRDNSQFANSFNFAVVARGTNGEAIDTMWIQNCTVSNSGLTFFGKLNPIKFAFMDHNTIVNTPKYPLFFDQYEEAYFTNNMWINCNWEGECQSTWETQLPDGVKSGIVNLDTIDPMLWELGHGYVPDMNNVKFMVSNNLHYTSPFLDKYYAGEFNDVGPYPLSNRDWSAAISSEDLPIPVENIPIQFLNEKTLTLINDYEGIVENRNFNNELDPLMKTNGIADQEVGDEFAHFARNNYGVANEGETYNINMIAFGDQDPQTVPGIETENGDGFTHASDLIEDFSYEAEVRSSIDGLPLGSLLWWPDLQDDYNESEALANVKEHYEQVLLGTSVEEVNAFSALYELSNNPNPFSEFTSIQFSLDKSSLVKINIYNAQGQFITNLVNQKMNSGTQQVRWNVNDSNAGVYFYTISIDERTISKRLIVQK
ncbi:T9SS type A sorting domain-containing protein [Portibacter marinus]|uniref:T9SS type A sorting domain-containing protein n=1 Tax=Portibacter marinus TaxID=2898660 RepID=UPI001F3E23BA|nr:T9SS type A sorting domain-containing protein [Portibacter marinus]